MAKKKGTIIFDCDGVILNSNSLKTDAFRLTLAEEPEGRVKEFIEYHKKFGGVSRYKKFNHYFTRINKTRNPDEHIKKAVTYYGDIVQKMLLECDTIPGILEYLGQIQNDYDIYVVSGGAQVELRDVFRQRGLSKYFSNIFGSPQDKNEILTNLKTQGKLSTPCYYFGDSELDKQMADHFGFDFIFVYGESEWSSAKQKINSLEYQCIKDFREIKLT